MGIRVPPPPSYCSAAIEQFGPGKAIDLPAGAVEVRQDGGVVVSRCVVYGTGEGGIRLPREGDPFDRWIVEPPEWDLRTFGEWLADGELPAVRGLPMPAPGTTAAALLELRLRVREFGAVLLRSLRDAVAGGVGTSSTGAR